MPYTLAFDGTNLNIRHAKGPDGWDVEIDRIGEGWYRIHLPFPPSGVPATAITAQGFGITGSLMQYFVSASQHYIDIATTDSDGARVDRVYVSVMIVP